MSIGPSSLNHLLVQRLDTVLGISQTPSKHTGAHPDALRHVAPSGKLAPEDRLARSLRQQAAGDKSAVDALKNRNADKHGPHQLTDNRYTASAPTTLGRTARTLLTILTAYPQQALTGQQPAIPTHLLNSLFKATIEQHPVDNTRPVQIKERSNIPAATSVSHSTPTALNQALATHLRTQIEQSGLFYESHLAQLSTGQKKPEHLQQQPQAQAHLASSTTEEKPSVLRNTPSTEPSTVQQLQQQGIEPTAQALVRQQLETLANQHLMWRGEAWPGVPMEWEIQRKPDEEQSKQELAQTDQAPWQTRIALELPHLGKVEARVFLEETSLRVQVVAPSSADHIQEHLSPLAERLSALGLRLDQLIVRRTDVDLSHWPPYEENTSN